VQNGHSTYVFRKFSADHSIERHQLQRVSGSFSTYEDFLSAYAFSDGEILTIPVDDALRSVWNEFTDDQRQQAFNTVVITQPRALWAAYQLITSDSHKHTLVWVVDGCYKFARSDQGKGCIFTIGVQVIGINKGGVVTRTFVPLCHALMTSESKHCVYVAVERFFHILRTYVFFQLPREITFVKDLHAGSSAGLKLLFPETHPNAQPNSVLTLVACLEHMRALFKRNLTARVPGVPPTPGTDLPPAISSSDHRNHMQYHWKLIHQSPSPQFERNLLNLFYRFWISQGEHAFVEYYRNNHDHIGLSHSTIKVPGILNDIQSQECYFGRVGGANRSTPSVLSRNTGIKNFLVNGVKQLLRYDTSEIYLRTTIGSWSPTFEHRIPCRSFFARALLIDPACDVFSLARLPTNRRRDGYLVRCTNQLGRGTISQAEVLQYFAHTENIQDICEWQGTFSQYAAIGLSFCWVRELPPSTDTSNPSLVHLQHSSSCRHYCSCRSYHQFLACPSTIAMDNPQLSIVRRYFDLTTSSNADRTRNRRPRKTPQPALFPLNNYFNLPQSYHNQELEFIYKCTPSQLTSLAKARGVREPARTEKVRLVGMIIDGTWLGRVVSQASASPDRRVFTMHSPDSFLPPPNMACDPFPEGVDESNPARCTSYFAFTPHQHPVQSHRSVDDFSLATCIQFAVTGGGDFFTSSHTFPAMENIQRMASYAGNRCSVREGNDALIHLDTAQEAILSLAFADTRANLSCETVHIPLVDTGGSTQMYLPFKVALDLHQHRYNPETHTLSACLIFGQTGLYLYRIPPPSDDDDEGVHDSELRDYPTHVPFYAILRPQTVPYYQHSHQNQSCTITLCRGSTAVLEFIDRILCQPGLLNSSCYN
jgi:hypothetical protein